MSILNQFEKETKLNLKNLSEIDLLNIFTNKKFHHFFDSAKKVVSLMEELSNEVESEEIKRKLITLKYKFLLVENENILMELFKNNREIIENKIESYMNSNDPLFSCSAILCCMLSLSNLDIRNKEEKLKENFQKISEIFKEISPVEDSFDLRNDLIDLVNTVEEQFWQVYEIDLSENSEWIHAEEAAMGEFSRQLHEKMKTEKIDDGLRPEDMHFIDITKLSE